MAVLRNNMALVKLLLQHGANPNQYELPNWLDVCEDDVVYKTMTGSFEHCFEYDGKLFAQDKYQSPMSAAKTLKYKKMVQLLESHGANTPLEVDREGYKLIHPCPFRGKTWDDF
mgnify:CR=1 FL=1